MLMIAEPRWSALRVRTLPEFRVSRMFGKNLDRDGSIQPRVSRSVHFPHSTGADRREDFMGTKQLSGLKRHWQGNLYQIGTAVTHLGHLLCRLIVASGTL